jgi:hypothetical protein
LLRLKSVLTSANCFPGDSGDERQAAADAERREKKARESMIQNEFKIRRKLAASKNNDNSSDDDEAEAIKNARVRGAEFTSKKIACLEVKNRESYLNLLEEQMRENYEKYKHHSATSAELKKLNQVIVYIHNKQIFKSPELIR